MANYTPGPWEVAPSSFGAYVILAQQGPLTVSPATAHGFYDAYLIAASPELLEAIKGILQSVDEELISDEATFFFTQARAAIAKAESGRC